MRVVALLAVVMLMGCPKREEAKPAPETKASAAPEIVYPIEALTCRDGVLGSTVAAAASAAPSSEPSGPPPSLSALLADAGSLFAPIGDGGFGVGGLGLSGVGGLGSGLGRAVRIVFPITAQPVDAQGPRALAVAKAACGASDAIERCHANASNPIGSLVFDITVAGNKALSAKKTGGDLADETLTTCVSAALVATNYESAANGTTTYKITFEPMKRIKPLTLKESPVSVTGRLPPEVIRRIIRAHFNRIRLCYDKALKSDPTLTGDLKVKFTIDPKGATKDATIADGTITDATMRSCVTGVFSSISFPEPEGGVVLVTYPIEFAPN